MELGSDESDEESEEDDDDKAEIKVQFNANNKQQNKNAKNHQEAKGIMGLKFMQRAESNKK